MQVGRFSPVVATTVVLLFTFVCGVIDTPPLNRHLGVAEFPPHSEASLSQPTPLVSRLQQLTDRIAVIYDRYSCAFGVLGEKDIRVYLCPPDVTYTFPAGFNPLPPVLSLSGNPSNRVGQPLQVSSARNNLSKKQTQRKPDARLPVEFRTRLFNKPKLDTTKFFAMAPLPEGFPGRELTTNDLKGRHVNEQKLIVIVQESIAQSKKYTETAAAPDILKISNSLISRLGTAKRRYSKFLSGKKSSGTMGILIFTSSVGIDSMLKNKLGKGESILLIYCKKKDPNTYYELIWEPNDAKYSTEILMTYIARFYHYVTYISFTPGRNLKESEDILMKAFRSPRANICSRGSPGEAKIILYTLQSLQTSPMEGIVTHAVEN